MTLVWESGITLQHPDNNDPLLDLNTQPSLDLQFATSKTLDDAVSGTNLITFSRASSGTYVGSDGLIKTAVTDAPRFDHDPVTGESLGLLIEEARTNLINYSEEFDNIYWTKFSSTSGTDPVVTPNYATAPDGTLTADRIVGTITPTGGTDYSLVRKVIATSGDHTWSIWLKSNTGSNQSITIKYVAIAGIVTVTPEWQRFSLTTTQSGFECDIGLQNEGLKVTSNSMDILAWGAQLEAGSFPTTYIPTTTSTVTRAADLASIEGTNFSSWYNQSEGTVFAEYDGLKEYGRVFALNGDRPLITSRSVVNQAYDGTTETSSLADLGLTLGDTRKSVTAYSGTTTTLTISGLVPVTGNTDFTSTTSTVAYLGGTGINSDVLNGHIARLAYYPYRLTDTTLQEITS